MFKSEYHHNIDEKGRIIIPTKFRNELGDDFIITRGLDNCLFLYPTKEWEKLTNKLNELSFTRSDARKFTRFFMSGAIDANLDKSGRVSISKPLVTYAELEKECVVIGMNERIEIWSLTKFNEYLNMSMDEISSISENLFQMGGI